MLVNFYYERGNWTVTNHLLSGAIAVTLESFRSSVRSAIQLMGKLITGRTSASAGQCF